MIVVVAAAELVAEDVAVVVAAHYHVSWVSWVGNQIPCL